MIDKLQKETEVNATTAEVWVAKESRAWSTGLILGKIFIYWRKKSLILAYTQCGNCAGKVVFFPQLKKQQLCNTSNGTNAAKGRYCNAIVPQACEGLHKCWLMVSGDRRLVAFHATFPIDAIPKNS